MHRKIVLGLKGVFLASSLSPLTLGVPANIVHLSEVQCMQANLYFEARSESAKAMKMIAQVTYNRKNKYKTSVCREVLKPWQFSWVKSVSYKDFTRVVAGELQTLTKKDRQALQTAITIAAIPEKELKVLPKSSMHYHTVAVNPVWNRKMQVHSVEGVHVFYLN